MFPEPYFPKWLKRIIKICFWCTLIFGLFLIVLGNIGGKDSMFKESIEQLVSERTGYYAEIDVAHNVRFFPNIILDFSILRLFKSEEKQIRTGAIGRWHSVMSFWDVMNGNGRFKYLLIQDASLNASSISEKTLYLDNLSIQKDDNTNPQNGFKLKAIGRIGEYDYTLDLPLQTQGKNYSQTFTFGGDAPTILNFGALQISGLIKKDTDGLAISNFSANMNEENLFENSNLNIDTNRNVYIKNINSSTFKKIITYAYTVLGKTKREELFADKDNAAFSLWGLTFHIERKNEEVL